MSSNRATGSNQGSVGEAQASQVCVTLGSVPKRRS
mgnify:CR=1 FL=1